MAILWAVTNGFLDDVPDGERREFESQFYRFLESERPDILTTLGDDKLALDDEIVASLRDAATAFKETFGA